VSVFVDVRVERRDVAAAVQVVCDFAWKTVSRMLVDPAPPAAGPEAELTLVLDGRLSESAGPAIVDELAKHGVSVLAWRARDWTRT